MTDRTVSISLVLRTQGIAAGVREAKRQFTDLTNSVQAGVQKNKASLDTLGSNLGRAGIAAAAGFGIAVKKFADFDAAMSSVKAATHETAGNMAALRDAALQAGKDTAFSATEAAGAIENLAKAGVKTQDILGGGLKGALDLAAAGQLAVGDAAETAATAMTQFGLSGKDVPHIADLLAAAAGKAQGEVSDVAMALKQGGLVASQFGLSIEETTGTLAAFASAGLIGSDAGTSFKTMLLALANPSAKAAGTLEDLGIAAYDTKGNFVGIGALAEQLKDKLSKLTPAQRDAALATIFGSDAIRAANVLYQNGAAGIADWTSKVNDQGYAAETAALKTDNLKGDVERLGGAIDTALIQSGEGANSTLRGLVQSADAAVSAFSDLPGWVQQGALALVGIGGAGALGAAGLIKAVQTASDLRAALQKLSNVGGGLKFSMGAIGLAVAAAVAIFAAWAKQNAEAKQRVSELKDTLDQATGSITKNTREYVANQLAVSGIAQKAKDLGLNLATLTAAALGNEDALGKVRTQLDAIANANMDPDTGALGDQAKAARDVGLALGDMNTGLSTAQQQTKLAAEGATENKSAQELQAEAVKKANEAFQAQAQSLSDVISQMHAASNAALELSGSQIGVQAALDDATKAAKDNGKTLDISTEKGRANRTALNDVAAAANTQTDAMLKAGKSNASVAKTAEASRAAFSKVAQQMGLSKKQADALAAALIDVPKTTKANVSAPGATGAKANVDALKTSIDGLKSKTVTITAKINASNVRAAVDARLAGKPNADGGYYPRGMFPSYADGKLPTQAMIAPGRGRGLVQWAEEETAPGEAFIPLAPGKRGRSMKILSQVAQHFGLMLVKSFASGGFLPGGKLVDPAYVLSQLNLPFNPTAGVNYAGTLAALNKANAAAAPARNNAIRADQAEQAAKNKVAQIQRAITLQQRYIAELRREDASAGKIASAQRALTKLQDGLYAAKNKATAATKASTAADAAYKTKAEAAAKAADAYKAAVQQLVEQQKAAVQMAGQIASGLTSGVDLGQLFQGSAANLLTNLQTTAAQTKKFDALINQLRGKKLDEDLISQIIGKGTVQGTALAQAILAAGAGYVAALNKAQQNLDDAANSIGANAASAQYGVKVAGARAGGGYAAANSAYVIGEGGRKEILQMGAQSGWVTPMPIDSNRFTSGSGVSFGGSTIARLHPNDLAALARAVSSRFEVHFNDDRLRGLIDVRAKALDDRQAHEFAVGSR